MTIAQAKLPELPGTPILLFRIKTSNGQDFALSSHSVSVQDVQYSARVLRHDVLELGGVAGDAIDALGEVRLVLANADSLFSQVHRAGGWKGASLTASVCFFDFGNGSSLTDPMLVFRGLGNPPDEVTESTLRVTFSSRMNLQRSHLPDVRIQRACPWAFPSTSAQREEALHGGEKGRYSPFYRCGYSADLADGLGSLDASGQPFTLCNGSREHCGQRGMLHKDSGGNVTGHFGGLGFVPATSLVRTYGDKSVHAAAVLENDGKYNEVVPLIYGTAWYRPPITVSRNDGNLTHLEVLLASGEINEVLKVIVNDVELPRGGSAANSTATGWYNIVNHGYRTGQYNLDFVSGTGVPVGDPYGSMAYLSVVVPNRVSDGTRLPRIDVLVEGMRLPIYDADGSEIASSFTNNPAWVILDLLRRCGWRPSEINFSSFARAAEYASERLETVDFSGQNVTIPRFGCNLVLRNRRSAADLIRGVRNSCGFRLRYDNGGALELAFEATFAKENPDKPEGSNSLEPFSGGWPCYEFGDGSMAASDLLRLPDESSSVRLWCRPTSETPNRYSIEFQDEFNAYQQDSLSLVDIPDAVANGFEVSGAFAALGVPSFHQAARILRLALDRSVRGNDYIEFQTGPRGIGLRPGDLITVSYAKEGLFRQPFRILHVALGTNYRTAKITAQKHDDLWYSDSHGQGELSSRDLLVAGRGGAPRGLLGFEFDTDGSTRFVLNEQYVERNDGAFDVNVTARFRRPSSGTSLKATAPFVSLAANVTTGGAVEGPQTYYYAISAIDEDGVEGPLSFLVPVHVVSNAGSTVKLTQIRSGRNAAAFNVYRGASPSDLMLIAGSNELGGDFEDSGLPAQLVAPPDPNYDHANLYWRSELVAPIQASIFGADIIGSTELTLAPDEYLGKIIRIVRGLGKGQERLVITNSATALTVQPAWSTTPDSTSEFVVAENGWQFGCSSTTESGTFGVPNRRGAAIHVLGLAANAHDVESSRETALFTRHVVGGAALDIDVPPVPIFALSSTGRGELTISSVGFETSENTRSISSGTLTIHYWNELSGIPPLLNGPVNDSAEMIELTEDLTAPEGTLMQIGSELMQLFEDANGTASCRLERGAFGTTAVDHAVGSRVHLLSRRVVILGFPRDFFGSAASGNYEHTVDLRGVRIAAAELFVSNLKGNGQIAQATYAGLTDGGIRTLSGGQICLQVDGVLAVEASAVVPLVLDRDYAVRSLYATVEQPASEVPIRVQLTVNGEAYGPPLEIAASSKQSTESAGDSLGPLRAQDRLSVDVLSVAGAAAGFPGARLTVYVRT